VPIAFGKYQLQRKLAEGGMAEVFLGRQAGMEGFEKLIVLKRIRPELSSDQNFVNMFLNEARVAARLNHPNIVQIFELGKVDKQYFIAMEFIHGEDLRSVTRMADTHKRHLPAGLTCRIIADTLAGLHYAHTRSSADGKPLGLVHRDVSPQNVLVTYEGGVKLVDFGIAKATRGGLTEQTRAGLFKGKFAYMSPEQSRGQPLDARSDIFAVGILLWELLTWTRLFKRANDMATLIAVAEEEIPSPLSFDPKLPSELERITMKALQRKVHMRYLTANEMRADIEALIRHQGWEADSMALQTYMQQIFSDKLRRQEEDIRESGFGSLEDFLLTVDEKSSVSWIKSVNVKTPSSGLPETRLPGMTGAATGDVATAHTQELSAVDVTAMPEVDSGGLELGGDPEELPGEATSFSAMPVFEDEPKARKIDSEGVGTADTAPITEIPKELRKPLFAAGKKPAVEPLLPELRNRATMPPVPMRERSTLPPLGVEKPSGELPSLPTAIVSRPELSALPTAIVAPSLEKVELPTKPTPAPGPSSTVELSAAAFEPEQLKELQPQPTTLLNNPNQIAMQAVTAPDDLSRTLPPGQMRAAVQPQPDPFKPENTTAQRLAFDPPARKPKWPFIAGGASLALVLLAVVAWPKAAPAIATLEINLDQPAVIAVDGKEEPVAQRASVVVKPGVPHVVTVLRDGKVARTLNVPGMAPGEQLQLNVVLR
jgi:eukaryotic-like serine/threonine-protein kinase